MTLLSLEILSDMSWGMLFRDLFSNMCIIIAITFIYMQLRWKWLEHRVKDCIYLIDGLAGGLLGILLMYYSIELTDHLILDLRYIVIVMILLFCGIRAAAISSVIVVLTRLALGLEFASYASLPVVMLIIGGYAFMNSTALKAADDLLKGLIMIIYSNIVFSLLMLFAVEQTRFLMKTISVYWILATFGGFVAMFFVIYIRRSHELLLKYEAESSTDFLTGLNNVRQFDMTWNESIRNAVERSERLSLLAIDIDFFKKVNDTFGHAAGDLVLEELGKVLRENARSFDIVSRNGGEEFSVILPDCASAHAFAIAERIRTAVEDHAFPIGGEETIGITISIGVASYPEMITEPSNMLHLADEYLYLAKQTGRNRVCDAACMREPVLQTD